MHSPETDSGNDCEETSKTLTFLEICHDLPGSDGSNRDNHISSRVVGENPLFRQRFRTDGSRHVYLYSRRRQSIMNLGFLTMVV
jgi:hypothetical protein